MMRNAAPLWKSIALALLIAVALTHCTTSSAGPPPRSVARFAKHDRARLAWLLSEGRTTTSVIIAYPPLHGDTLMQRLAQLGGRLQYQSDTLGYLRVDLPTLQVLAAAALPGIDAINLNGTQVYGASIGPEADQGAAQQADVGQAETRHPGATPPRPHRTAGHAVHRPDSVTWRVAPPDASTPPENPYLPMRDVGAPQFVAAHPTFDGRGVTIGSLECCPDFRHPVFQEPALTISGQPTRKLAALYTVVAADSEAEDRVHLRDSVTALRRQLTYDSVTYHAPHDGSFRIGYYVGATGFKTYEQMKADTLSVPTQRRAVLLDPHSGEVWVDDLNDHDFAHSPALHDYNTSGEVGTFGRDDPATPWDDRLTFAVGVDTARALVDVYPGSQGHITGVAGIVVGTRFYGSRATGAAPHARMVLVSTGSGWKGMESHQSSRIEGLILLARYLDVDIITTQEWYDLRLKDGGSVWSTIADRVVTTYHKVLFQSAGNDGPGLGTGYEAVNGLRVMKVGGSIHRDTWYSTFALLADRADYLFNESSRGPYADGRLGPDFVTPMVQLIAQPMGTSGDPQIRNNTGFFSPRTIYRNPAGYTLQFGTSHSAPTAAGVAALLISAARQTDTPVDAARLRWALAGGARYLPGYQAYEQGAGILNAPAAWARLQHAPMPVEITIDAPVRTILSPYLRTPGRGHGLYEREGWAAGDSATRQVTLTRTSGPAEPVTYQLRWLGDDGTFTSQPGVTLGLNGPVSVPVLVHPRTAGAHSALLQLLGPDGVTPAQEMSAVVVAAQPLDAAHRYTFSDHGHAEWLGKTSYFVAVAPGAAALDLTLTIERGAVALSVIDPTGGCYPTAVPSMSGHHYDWPTDIALGFTKQQMRGVVRRTLEFPEPGVWEVVIAHEGSRAPALRLKPQATATFTFTAAVTRLAAQPVAAPAGAPLRLTVHNEGAALAARLVGGPLASVAREQLAFKHDGPAVVRELVIDSGTTRLGVQLMRPSDPEADLDVHLFDCTSGHCDRHVSAVLQGAEKELRVQQPHPGRWRIVIDPYEVPEGTTTVEYRTELVHPKYGSVAVIQPRIQLPAGRAATVVLAIRPRAAVEPGRSRAVRLEVQRTEEQSPSGPAPWGQHYPPGVLGVVRADLGNDPIGRAR